MSIKFTSHKSACEAAVDAAISRALEICGGTAEGYAKENLTKNGSVQTGVLRNSITHQRKDKYTMAVGTKVEYAPYVELGHNQQPGRYVPAIKKRLVAAHVNGKPYLRPAVEGHREEYERIIQTELKDL